MKKSWKWVLCLALTVALLCCAALAADAPEIAQASGCTVTEASGVFNVTVPATADSQYVLFMVKPLASLDTSSAQALLTAAQSSSTTPYALDTDTIYYINQFQANGSTISFPNFQPRVAATCLFVVGGGAEGQNEPRIVGAMVTQGVSVSGTVTVKEGSNSAATVTVAAGDISENVTLTNGVGTYTLSGVATDVTTLTASSGTKFVAREYTIDASADVTQNIVLNPKGDTVQDGTGTVNIQDVNALYAHTQRNGTKLTGYALECGKVLGNSTINIQDVNALYAHTQRNGTKLW